MDIVYFNNYALCFSVSMQCEHHVTKVYLHMCCMFRTTAII